MNKTIRIIGVSVAVLAVFAIWCFISYKPDKGIETVLDTMLTSPNEDIFSLSGTINTPLSDSEYETVYLTEKAVWEEAVGKYFAEKRFDSFMKQWERTEFLVKAAIDGDVIEVGTITCGGDKKVRQVTAPISVKSPNGETVIYSTKWLFVLDQDNKIQRLELIDDGGYLTFE